MKESVRWKRRKTKETREQLVTRLVKEGYLTITYYSTKMTRDTLRYFQKLAEEGETTCEFGGPDPFWSTEAVDARKAQAIKEGIDPLMAGIGWPYDTSLEPNEVGLASILLEQSEEESKR